MKYPQITLARARRLRREMTHAERTLWTTLENRQLAFRRQEPVGEYFVDFCCVEHKLIIELDGVHHAEDRQIAYDERRTGYLRKCGYRVLRFWNTEVLEHLEAVLASIETQILGGFPSPSGRGDRGGEIK